MARNLTRELKKIIRGNDCHFVRQGKGDHEIWFSPRSKQHFPVDGNIPSRHLAYAVLKQAGLPKAFRLTEGGARSSSIRVVHDEFTPRLSC